MTLPQTDAAPSPLTALLRGLTRGEALAAFAIFLVALIAWAWIATLPPMNMASAPANMPSMTSTPNMPGMAMPSAKIGAIAQTAPAWDMSRALATFAMWTVMMGAMMLPAAAPIVLLHRRTARNQSAGAAPAPSTSLLILGYAIVWTLFAAAATSLQWGLSKAALLSDMDALADRRIAAGVLVLAGLYQITPLKQSCLALCRSPFEFLMRHYRPGALGALRMGLAHGVYCLGCCWAAMALLFVGGVMNLLWVAGLTIFVLVEKVLPFGRIAGLATGAGTILAGIWLLTAPM